MGFWGEDHRGKLPYLSHHFKGIHYYGDITFGIDLGHLTEEMLTKFFQWKVAPPPSFGPVFFRRKSLQAVFTKSEEVHSVSVGKKYLH